MADGFSGTRPVFVKAAHYLAQGFVQSVDKHVDVIAGVGQGGSHFEDGAVPATDAGEHAGVFHGLADRSGDVFGVNVWHQLAV